MTAPQKNIRELDWLPRTGAWLCLCGAALGALGLLGWITGTNRLTAIFPGLPPMMPTTGAGLLLIGLAGALRQQDNRIEARNIVSLLASIAVLAICAGAFGASIIGGIAAPGDRLAAALPAAVPPVGSWPPMMTALSMTFLVMAVASLNVTPIARVRPSELLVAGAALTAFTGLTGIILGAPALYQSARAPIIGLSLPSAVSLLLTSLGVLLLRPWAGIMGVTISPGPGGMLLRRLALPAIALPVAVGLVVTQLAATQRVEQIPVPIAIFAASMAALSLLLLGLTAPLLNRAHEDLQASRARTRSLVEQAPDGIFVADLEGRYIDVNDLGCRMLGYTRDEILGTSIVDLIPPDDLQRLEQARQAVLRGSSHIAEWQVRHKDGTYVPMEISSKLLPDGRWQGFVRDISERKRIENERRFLAEMGQALATTLDYEETAARVAEVAVQGFSDFCVIDLVDEGSEMRRLKFACREPSRAWICDTLLGLQVGEPRPPLIQKALTTREPVVIERPPFHEVAGLAGSASHREALRALELHSLMILPLVAHETLLGAISFLFEHRYAHALDELRMALEIANRAALAIDNARLYRVAQRAIQARDDVLGIVAHDLRNPLSVILIETRVLRAQGPEPQSQDSADVIEGAATRMDRLIQDLLDVTRIEGGGLTIERRPVSVEEVTSAAARIEAPLASSTALELRLEVETELPDVWADRDRLLQVLENLIGNAIKVTPPGGSVTVGAARNGTDVAFWVSDTGPGIDPADQPRLFDRFWQGRTKRRPGDAGLGLAIVKGIVEAHEGRIRVETAPGEGCTFHFTIPIAEAAAGQVNA